MRHVLCVINVYNLRRVSCIIYVCNVRHVLRVIYVYNVRRVSCIIYVYTVRHVLCVIYVYNMPYMIMSFLCIWHNHYFVHVGPFVKVLGGQHTLPNLVRPTSMPK